LQGILAVNARFRGGPQTGVQRVAAEIVPRLGMPYREIAPRSAASGMKGHAWEQFILPFKASGAPLWSPCNTGPLAVRSQVVTIHDAAVFDHPEWFSRQFVTIYRHLLPRLARSARRIVTVSEFSRMRLASALNLPLGRIEVVLNGVSAQFTPRTSEEIAAAAARYGVRPGSYFASLSTLEPRKNLALTLKAWNAVRADLPADTQLLLIGGTGKAQIFAPHEAAAAGAQEEGIVRAGFVPDSDLPALLGGATALLYPSRYEGFGLPVLEAMACGTPVVTADGSSLREVAATAALYVDPDDPAGLARALRALSGDAVLRSELRDAGLAQARLFSWDDTATKMRHILQRDLAL
jgi:glycosyltransferase involved in cell wall biosynthesis